MKWKTMSAEARVRFVTGAILVAGFATAIVIYFVNAAPDDASGYRLEDSKKYVREMEIYGGKMNVLASELGNWFSGLWHGRSLAFTVAVITVLVALAYRVLATPLLPLAADSDAAHQANGAEAGRKHAD
jgi:hypothetical protein